MSSYTQPTSVRPLEVGGSGTRQAAFLRPLPGERRDAPAAGAGVAELATGGNEVLRRLFPIADQSDEQDISPGTAVGVRLGHYLIEERIGRGGMGGVFRAVDERLNRVVALKVLAPSSARDPAAVERFRNEGQAAARLDHENIARVYYIGDDHGVPFIAFEFVRGMNVRDVILQKGMLSPEEAVNYTLQIAQALRHTSAARVVHRDIKPSNIIITPSGHAKLVDLGLARQEHSEPTRELTTPGTTLGTFDYIAPEQARDPRCVDVRTDIYSLGCTLYHMLTGQPPFPQGTIIQKVVDHHLDAPPDPAVRNPLVPPRLSEIVRTMMASSPDDRFSGPDELIAELSQVAASLGLRPTHADNMIWSRPLYERQPGFFDLNKGWLLAISLLLLIAAVIWKFPELQPPASSTADSGLAATDGTGLQAPPEPAAVDPDGDSPETTRDAVAPAAPESEQAGGMLTGLSALELQAEGEPVLRATSNRAAGPTGNVEASSVSPGGVARRTDLGADEVVRTIDQLNSPVPGRQAPGTGSGTEASREAARPFVVVDARGTLEQEYATLDEACRKAASGDVIELRFDGRIGRQPPIRVYKKRLTIRAEQGRRPVIEFQSPTDPTHGAPTRMFQITGGSLSLQNIDVSMPVQSGRFERWVMFSLVHAQQLQLDGVSIVMSNPERQPAAVVEFAAPPGDDVEAMMPGSMQRAPVSLDWRDCLVRAECDLIVSETLEAADVVFDNLAVGVRGTLARIEGQSLSNDRVRSERPLSILLRDVTALLYDGLIRVDTGTDRDFASISVDCDQTALVVRPGEPLIEMRGLLPAATLQRRILWQSRSSALDVTEPVWEIVELPEPLRKHLAIDDLDYSGQPIVEHDLLARRLSWKFTDFASLSEESFQLRPQLVEASSRTDATGVRFGDPMPSAETFAASRSPRDDGSAP